MALGDCIDWPCGSPLDFDRLLVSLFAVNSSGCVGLKAVIGTASCEDMIPATSCGENLTLQEIVTRAIVDDGAGGHALNMTSITDMVTCTQDCATYQDLETILKSLFSVDANGCFTLRFWAYSGGCENLEDYQQCTASLTAEQVIRTSLWRDACGQYTLGAYQADYEPCVGGGCATHFPLDLLIKMMFRKYDAAQCGAINLNYAAVGIDALTDLQECAKLVTFEEALRQSLIWNDCGLALTVWGLVRGGQN